MSYNGYVSLIGKWKIDECSGIQSGAHIYIGFNLYSCVYYFSIFIIMHSYYSFIESSFVRYAIPLSEIIPCGELSHMPIHFTTLPNFNSSSYIHLKLSSLVLVRHTYHVHPHTFFNHHFPFFLHHFVVLWLHIRRVAGLSVESEFVDGRAVVHEEVLEVGVVVGEANCWSTWQDKGVCVNLKGLRGS